MTCSYSYSYYHLRWRLALGEVVPDGDVLPLLDTDGVGLVDMLILILPLYSVMYFQMVMYYHYSIPME